MISEASRTPLPLSQFVTSALGPWQARSTVLSDSINTQWHKLNIWSLRLSHNSAVLVNWVHFLQSVLPQLRLFAPSFLSLSFSCALSLSARAFKRDCEENFKWLLSDIPGAAVAARATSRFLSRYSLPSTAALNGFLERRALCRKPESANTWPPSTRRWRSGAAPNEMEIIFVTRPPSLSSLSHTIYFSRA